MCGLYGMINKFKTGYFNDYEVGHFYDMGWVTALRGRDSSSIWGISRDHPERIPREWKAIGDSSYLQYTKAGNGIERFMTKEAIAMFGHGRKATMGKVSLDNQHPFRHKHIILMHNGTINGGLDNKEVEVDSHALAIQVAEDGVEAALAKVEGAFAIIAYDLNKQRIIIARNYQRDLHYVEMSDMIFIMSEKKALELILDRMSRKNEFAKEFTPMKIYEIDPLNASVKESATITKKWPTYNTTYLGETEGEYKDHLPSVINPDLMSGWTRGKGGVLIKEKDIKFSKRVDDSTWKLKQGQITKFVVEDCKKPDKHNTYRYWGVDLLGHHVVFFCNDHHPEWIDRIGYAPVVAATPDKPDEDHKELTYIIAPREITWTKNWSDLIEPERELLLGKTACDICGQPFDEDDINMIIVNSLAPLKAVHGDCETGLLETERKLADDAHSHIPI